MYYLKNITCGLRSDTGLLQSTFYTLTEERIASKYTKVELPHPPQTRTPFSDSCKECSKNYPGGFMHNMSRRASTQP